MRLNNSIFFYFKKLLDVVYREETLLNVIRCVTKNAKSVLLTAVFAVILIYLFSICGFLFLQNDFIMEVDPETDRLTQNQIDNQNKIHLVLNESNITKVENENTGNLFNIEYFLKSVF
jgi:hypothetical protein